VIGAICGDIVGSIYEFNNIKTKDFKLFGVGVEYTDDTVLTVATMDALINDIPYAESYKKWFRKYPNASYGGNFYRWGYSDSLEPYNSWGNGSAMRVSPVGLWFETMDETRAAAALSAAATHNHPEGVKGAESVAAAVYLASHRASKQEIKEYIEKSFGYDLSERIDSIRKWYEYDISCKGTVPPAVICFLESTDFEDAIRLPVSIGGDSDTLACITGGIAEAYYGIPEDIRTETLMKLPGDMISVIEQYYTMIESRKANLASQL